MTSPAMARAVQLFMQPQRHAAMPVRPVGKPVGADEVERRLGWETGIGGDPTHGRQSPAQHCERAGILGAHKDVSAAPH